MIKFKDLNGNEHFWQEEELLGVMIINKNKYFIVSNEYFKIEISKNYYDDLVEHGCKKIKI